MEFDQKRTYGNMLRVTEIDVPRTWDLFFKTLKEARAKGIIR
jgi:hypothetical protein